MYRVVDLCIEYLAIGTTYRNIKTDRVTDTWTEGRREKTDRTDRQTEEKRKRQTEKKVKLSHLSPHSDIVDAIFTVKSKRSLPQPDPATGNDDPEVVHIFRNKKFVI